jgi:hypothetical protein
MITAKEAKAISNKYTPDIIATRELSFIERQIMEAADIGYTSIYYTSKYSNSIHNKIITTLKESGYNVFCYLNNEYCISWEQPNENQTTPTGETP